MNEITISEVFGPTIQGEGALVGRPTVFVRTGGCDFRCNWCVAPETPITLADWTTKPAREMRAGDEIVGLARRPDVPEVVGTYQTGEVLGVVSRQSPRVRVTFEDEREVCVASEHAFAMFKTGRFRGASKLRVGDRLKALQGASEWRETDPYRAGYLAGAADGDGSFHEKAKAGVWHFVIATADDEILARFQKYACELGFALQNGRHSSGGQFAPARHIGCLRLTRSGEVLRFQQMLRAHELTPDFCRGYFAGMFDTNGSSDGKTLALCQIKPHVREKIARVLDVLGLLYTANARGFRLRGGFSMSRRVLRETRPALRRKTEPILWARGGHDEFATVQKVELVDAGEVISIKTSLGTYIAGDVVSRNCDSLYAVLPEHKGDWHRMTADAVLSEVERLSGGHPILITLSGGNPALQPLEALLDLGHARGHSFAMETQGTRSPEWLAKLDHLVLSPKPPSSRMEFKPELLARCLEAAGPKPHVSLKIVVFDEDDYRFARRVQALHPAVPFFLSVGNPAPLESVTADTGDLTARLEWLLERCARDGWFTPTILPQLHVLLWGNKRGV